MCIAHFFFYYCFLGSLWNIIYTYFRVFYLFIISLFPFTFFWRSIFLWRRILPFFLGRSPLSCFFYFIFLICIPNTILNFQFVIFTLYDGILNYRSAKDFFIVYYRNCSAFFFFSYLITYCAAYSNTFPAGKPSLHSFLRKYSYAESTPLLFNIYSEVMAIITFLFKNMFVFSHIINFPL